jgi:hypothetical protein
MTKLCVLFFFMGILCAAVAPETATAQLSRVCPNVQELGPNQYKNNSPIRAAGVGTPIQRFALNPTIIFIRGNPARLSRANVYDSAGNFLTSGQRLGCAAPGRGTCNSRYKGSEVAPNDTRSVRRRAVANTRSPAIFWRVANNLCIRIPDAGRCYNVQVRGFCDGRVVG